MPDLALFSLSDEHKMIRDAARDFAQSEIVPVAAEFDESGEFPQATIRKMGEMGFMGIEIPEEATALVERGGMLNFVDPNASTPASFARSCSVVHIS